MELGNMNKPILAGVRSLRPMKAHGCVNLMFKSQAEIGDDYGSRFEQLGGLGNSGLPAYKVRRCCERDDDLRIDHSERSG